MKYFIPVLILILLGGWPSHLFGQNYSIIDYYHFADSISTFPPVDQELSLASKKIDNWYVTFVGIKGQPKVLFAAVTLEPITDPKSISLTIQFTEGMKPSVGKISTWGYVFDRNRDGKIDYMALLGGGAPFEENDFPKDYPTRVSMMSQSQLEYYISHCKLAFNHWADDNYDGNIDAVVHVDLDPLRDWINRHIVIRSTTFGSTFNDVWAFRENLAGRHDSVSHKRKSVPYISLARRTETLTSKTLAEQTAILNLLNRAAKELKFTEENFDHPEEGKDNY